MQQPWANIFLLVNGDGDDALGLGAPELPVISLLLRLRRIGANARRSPSRGAGLAHQLQVHQRSRPRRLRSGYVTCRPRFRTLRGAVLGFAAEARRMPLSVRAFLVHVRDPQFYAIPRQTRAANGRLQVMGFPPIGIMSLSSVLKRAGHEVTMFDQANPDTPNERHRRRDAAAEAGPRRHELPVDDELSLRQDPRARSCAPPMPTSSWRSAACSRR